MLLSVAHGQLHHRLADPHAVHHLLVFADRAARIVGDATKLDDQFLVLQAGPLSPAQGKGLIQRNLQDGIIQGGWRGGGSEGGWGHGKWDNCRGRTFLPDHKLVISQAAQFIRLGKLQAIIDPAECEKGRSDVARPTFPGDLHGFIAVGGLKVVQRKDHRRVFRDDLPLAKIGQGEVGEVDGALLAEYDLLAVFSL